MAQDPVAHDNADSEMSESDRSDGFTQALQKLEGAHVLYHEQRMQADVSSLPAAPQLRELAEQEAAEQPAALQIHRSGQENEPSMRATLQIAEQTITKRASAKAVTEQREMLVTTTIKQVHSEAGEACQVEKKGASIRFSNPPDAATTDAAQVKTMAAGKKSSGKSTAQTTAARGGSAKQTMRGAAAGRKQVLKQPLQRTAGKPRPEDAKNNLHDASDQEPEPANKKKRGRPAAKPVTEQAPKAKKPKVPSSSFDILSHSLSMPVAPSMVGMC